MKCKCITVFFLLLLLAQRDACFAKTTRDIVGPEGSGSFGTTVKFLPNGNMVVVDPTYSSGTVSDIGAVYLYTNDGQLISKVTGSAASDKVGDKGVVILANGNFVVMSGEWNNPTPLDTTNNIGAVTWIDGSLGLSGEVSADNSLVGETTESSPDAFTVTPLQNGNYVVTSFVWQHDGIATGAATLGDGAAGTVGQISTANSLFGSSQGDGIGQSLIPLSNGNYVVASQFWSNGSAIRAGAVTWCDGDIGLIGAVSPQNSLVGSTKDDQVGSRTVALANGNYVVTSLLNNDAGGLAGAGVTLGDGAKGVAGTISTLNSLMDDSGDPEIHVTLLANSNFVVGAPRWHGLGAATWVDGKVGIHGMISTTNSTVGSPDDGEGGVGSVIVALTNGNYVIGSGNVATWVDGSHSVAGVVTPENSLTATMSDDISITPLANGNYVVSTTTWWTPTFAYLAGAASWGNGLGGTTGVISSNNSLVGTAIDDGVSQYVTPLANGNYVIGSLNWNDSSIYRAGAATFGNGESGVAGFVTPQNSLVGSSQDEVGMPIALSNGNYLVASSAWANSTGIVIWVDGTKGAVGDVSLALALTGAAVSDEISYGGITTYPNGNYVVSSPMWSSGGATWAGAITLVHGNGPPATTVSASNSIVGITKFQGFLMTFDYDVGRDRLAVGRPLDNIVSLLNDDFIFQSSFQ